MIWINVNERLPEIDENVLVTNGENMYVAWVEKYNEKRPIWQYSYCCGCYCDGNIIYWSYLPEQPLNLVNK